jgi:hypothetical protein
MTDDLESKLRAIKAQLPAARTQLSEDAKDELIRAVGGPRTAESIRKAMSKLPHERIPWLFSSLDSQLVVDIMGNDMEAAIARAKAGQNREHS